MEPFFQELLNRDGELDVSMARVTGAVLIVACGLAGIPRNMFSDRINLKTVRPPARRKKKPGAFLNDRRDIENSHALYFANIQWSRKQAYNNFKKSSIS